MLRSNVNRDALGCFLRARRAELRPADVGLPEPGGPRRVTGLRREEVARLACISIEYYTRLEQGRITASASALAAVSRALRLDEDGLRYLNELAGKLSPRLAQQSVQTVRPPLRRILEQLTDSVALVLGPYTEVLAWTPLAAALLTDFAQVPEAERNYVRLVFTHPQVRGALVNWRRDAQLGVAFLRMQARDRLADPRLAALVEDLSRSDPDFAVWWASYHVCSATTGTKTLRHPTAGEITLDWELLASETDPEQQLLVMTAEPGSPSHRALRRVAMDGTTRRRQPTLA